MNLPPKSPPRVAVVTGAGSGIGRSLAQQLAAQGYVLALCDVNPTSLAETAGKLSTEVLPRVVDVSDRAAVEAFGAATLEKFGHVDLVINNAGVDLFQTVADCSYEDFEWVMGINFWGVVYGTKTFLPGMLARNSGTVVNISSLFGIVAWANHGAYASAKFAVRGFTEALQKELQATAVKAMVVHPGGIDTNIAKGSRVYVDERGRKVKADVEKAFKKVAKLTPEHAAKAIIRAVDIGQGRLLIGSDASMGDRIVRLLPQKHWAVLQFVQRYFS